MQQILKLDLPNKKRL